MFTESNTEEPVSIVLSSVWINFRGPNAEMNLGHFELALNGLVVIPRPVPDIYAVVWAGRSIYPLSIDLRLTNGGGSVDLEKIKTHLRFFFASEVEVGLIAQTDLPESELVETVP